MYYVSFAIVAWVDVFTRKDYRQIIIESLEYCQSEKGLIIYGWCIMSNHAHLIISAKENNVSDVLGDFKKFTAKKIIKTIKDHPGESRKEWMLKIFKKAEKKTAGIQNINFGNRILSQRLFIHQTLLRRN